MNVCTKGVLRSRPGPPQLLPLLLMLLSLLPTRAVGRQAASQEADEAVRYFGQGRFREVITLLERHGEGADLEPAAATMLGVSYYALGRCELAIPYLETAIELGAKPEVVMMAAVCLDILGRPEEAVRELPDLRDSASLLATFHIFRGDTWANRGRADRAIEDYQTALQVEPDLPGVPYRLGMLYSDTHQYERARESFEHELSINPSNPAAAYSLGEYYLVWGEDLAKAERWFRRSLEVSLDHLPGYLGLMKVQLARNQPEEAVRSAMEAERRGFVDPALLHLKARALRRLGRIAEADEAVRQYRALTESEASVPKASDHP